MTPRKPLEWSGCWPACIECFDHLRSQGLALLEACASVGIENGNSAGENLRIYMQGHHDRHLDEALEERRAKQLKGAVGE